MASGICSHWSGKNSSPLQPPRHNTRLTELKIQVKMAETRRPWCRYRFEQQVVATRLWRKLIEHNLSVPEVERRNPVGTHQVRSVRRAQHENLQAQQFTRNMHNWTKQKGCTKEDESRVMGKTDEKMVPAESTLQWSKSQHASCHNCKWRNSSEASHWSMQRRQRDKNSSGSESARHSSRWRQNVELPVQQNVE